MTGQKIKRGGKSVRKVASARGKARQVRAAKARTGSAIDTVMAISRLTSVSCTGFSLR